jgi:hypothetical protein
MLGLHAAIKGSVKKIPWGGGGGVAVSCSPTRWQTEKYERINPSCKGEEQVSSSNPALALFFLEKKPQSPIFIN